MVRGAGGVEKYVPTLNVIFMKAGRNKNPHSDNNNHRERGRSEKVGLRLAQAL